MVLQNVAQLWKGEQIFSRDAQGRDQGSDRSVCWREHRERSFRAQSAIEACGQHRSFEQRVIFAVDDDVHHGSIGGFVDHDAADHAQLRMRADAAVVLVGARHGERDSANANAFGATHHRAEVELFGVVERHAVNGACDAVHVVLTTEVDKRDRFADLNVEDFRGVLEAARLDGVVRLTLSEGESTHQQTSEKEEEIFHGFGFGKMITRTTR